MFAGKISSEKTQNGRGAAEIIHTTNIEVEPRPFRWTTEKFQRLGELDMFVGRHVELIEGEILEMTVGTSHFTAVMKSMRALERAFGPGFHARPQGPLNLNEHTDPEPDVAIVAGDIADYSESHPTTAVLVIEVSDSTLRHDQTRKVGLYARAGIIEYWIVNLKARQLEVHRQPQHLSDREFGHAYAQTQTFAATDSVSPLAAPQAAVRVADLLP